MTDVFRLILESFQTMTPFLVLLVPVVLVFIYLLFKITRVSDYKHDAFRHDIEKQMYELSKQLAVTDERFRSINHLLLAAQSSSSTSSKSSSSMSSKSSSSMSSKEDDKHAFFSDMGVSLDVPVQDDLIFLLMPFNLDYAETYSTVKNVCQEAGFRCLRGDEKVVSGEILRHILNEIVKARLVIADITGRNPNVFYELGIAHALGKPVLLISQTSQDIPFDISHVRVLTYRNSNQLAASLKNWLIGTFARMEGKKRSANY
jgi:hypothetical protein